MALESSTQQAASLVPSPAETHIAVQRLREAFPDLALRAYHQFGQSWATVPSTDINTVCRFLRDDPATQFAMLLDITAVDLLPKSPRWEVVYQLLSLEKNLRFRIKAELEDGVDPSVHTITDLYPSANFYEREIFDLMGIRFTGHPDLRRILLPDDWQGYPLRYDHPVGGDEVGFTS